MPTEISEQTVYNKMSIIKFTLEIIDLQNYN